jgi:DME family drug/metabolite transporter
MPTQQPVHLPTRPHAGEWLVLAACLCWGTTGTAQALGPDHASPLAVGAIRLAVGGSALLALALFRRVLKPYGWPPAATAVAVFHVALYQVTFFAAVRMTGVAVGTMVAMGSSPIFAGVTAYLVRGERPGRRWAISTALAVLGCCLLVLAGSRSVSADPLGIGLALITGFAYATYTLAGKQLLDKHPPDAAMAVMFFGGAILLSPLFFLLDFDWFLEPRGLASGLHLGLVATALAYVFFSRGLRLVPVATAVTLSLAEPLTAATLGLLLLGERLTPLSAAGMGLLFVGLALLAVRGKAPRARIAAPEA